MAQEDEPRDEAAAPRPEDYVVLLAQVPERVADFVSGLDDQRLRHRHAPAIPTLEELVAHVARSGTLVDALFRHVCIDGQREIDLRGALDPPDAAEHDETLAALVEGFARDRRRTADLLRGLDPAGWESTVGDARLGELTLLRVCELVGNHEAAHLTQLRNLLALVPEPTDLGPIRR